MDKQLIEKELENFKKAPKEYKRMMLHFQIIRYGNELNGLQKLDIDKETVFEEIEERFQILYYWLNIYLGEK